MLSLLLIILGVAPPPPAPPAPPLAGPKVAQSAAGTSLVELDYAGHVRRLDSTPEEAALKLLDLSDTVRGATERILVERARILDAFVVENIPLLTKLGAAGESGRKLEALGLGTELYQKLAPLRERGTLRQELSGVLPPDQHSRFDSLVDGYWDAVVRDRQASDHKPRLAILIDQRLKGFGDEIGRSFKRRIDGGAERDFDALLASLNLSPDQETRIRHWAEEFIIGAKFNPTEKQEGFFILRVMSILSAEQRQTLVERIAAEERRKNPPAAQPTPKSTPTPTPSAPGTK